MRHKFGKKNLKSPYSSSIFWVPITSSLGLRSSTLRWRLRIYDLSFSHCDKTKPTRRFFILKMYQTSVRQTYYNSHTALTSFKYVWKTTINDERSKLMLKNRMQQAWGSRMNKSHLIQSSIFYDWVSRSPANTFQIQSVTLVFQPLYIFAYSGMIAKYTLKQKTAVELSRSEHRPH